MMFKAKITNTTIPSCLAWSGDSGWLGVSSRPRRSTPREVGTHVLWGKPILVTILIVFRYGVTQGRKEM